MKNKIIRLNKAKKIFPNEITKVRSHDLINLSVIKKKHLTNRETTKLQNLANEIRMGSGNFKYNRDVLAVRKTKQIKFIPF